MKAPTKEITLPVSGFKVLLRQWITNAQLEYAEEPIQRLAEFKVAGADQGKQPVAQHEASARGREVFTEKILVPAEGETPAKEITGQAEIRSFYNELPATDVLFVNLQINELTEADKKKLPQPSTSGPTPTAN